MKTLRIGRFMFLVLLGAVGLALISVVLRKFLGIERDKLWFDILGAGLCVTGLLGLTLTLQLLFLRGRLPWLEDNSGKR